jgi:YVTN family beta-propeller protein
VWVANSRDGTVSTIDPHTNEVGTLRLGFRPAAVAVDRRAVWVALAAWLLDRGRWVMCSASLQPRHIEPNPGESDRIGSRVESSTAGRGMPTAVRGQSLRVWW